MDFELFLKKNFPTIKIAEPCDNEKLLLFYNSLAIKTKKTPIGFNRSPDFFKLLNYQSDRYFVMFTEDPNGEINFTCTLLIQKAYFNREVFDVACISALRVKFSWHHTVSWKKLFINILQHYKKIDEFNNCISITTHVFKENDFISKALRKAKTSYYFSTISQLDALFLIGRKRPLPKQKGEVYSPTKNEMRELEDFLNKENINKPYGHVYSELFKHQLEVWDELSTSSFQIVRGQNKKIIASMGHYSISNVKSLFLSTIPGILKYTKCLLPLIGRPRLRTNESLKILYLTHLEFDSSLSNKKRADYLLLMIQDLYEKKIPQKYHAVALVDFSNSALSPYINKYFLIHKSPIEFYEVKLRPSGEFGPLLVPYNDRSEKNPGFELCLI